MGKGRGIPTAHNLAPRGSAAEGLGAADGALPMATLTKQ